MKCIVSYRNMTISFNREGLEHKATKHLSDLIERIPQRS